MTGYKRLFQNFENSIWLNAASEGPLPISAAKSLQEAVEWKSKPYLLDHHRFGMVPKELKQSIGRLIGVNERDVILGNSASYGLHLLSNGIPFEKGDEILTMQNDFPTNILPFLGLAKNGIVTKQISAKKYVLNPEELEKNITKKTKLFCISHVHTFSGYQADIKRLGEICRKHKIIFVVNISQSAGTMPIDVATWPVDAVVCAGYKWLCGPYGSGFCWLTPQLRETLELNQAYWISVMSEEDLKSEGTIELRDVKTSRKYDIFGTANFFNFVPFKASLDMWLEIGLDKVYQYHQDLVEQFIKSLSSKYSLISPREKEKRSSLIFISHQSKAKNAEIHAKLTAAQIHTAFWKGNIRISPHIYNDRKELDKIIEVLTALS